MTSGPYVQHVPNLLPHAEHGHAVHPGALLYCTHAPFAQYSSGAHALLQVPQLSRSFCRSAHPAGPASGPQRVVPDPHPPNVATSLHAPSLQYSPLRHFLPQEPQFKMSLAKSLHPRHPGPPHAP